MEVKAQDQIAFYLTSAHIGSALRTLDRGYRPALFARYGDLTSLRYDFPLVLNTVGSPERAVLSLSGLVDDAVNALQEDINRDRIARHGYELERQLRRELASVGSGTPASHGDFATLWNAAASRLTIEDKTDDRSSIEDSAKRLWKLFQASGELVDVDFALPARIARHVWSVVQANKRWIFRNQAERLLLKLHSILEAEIANSEVGRSPERLKASVGTSFANVFDFDIMSNVLVRAKPAVRISDDRRNRIQHLIDVLEHQRFFPIGSNAKTYEFIFYRAADAVKAYKERHREAVELVKALMVAKLEVSGEYRESGKVDDKSSANGTLEHTAIFEDFGVDGLDAGQLALLPDYLVCKYSSELDAEETMQIVDALSTGLPIKILLQTDDLLEPSVAQARLAGPERHGGLASRSRHITESTIGQTDVFVLQSSISQAFRLRDDLFRGMAYHGPAFFSVFSGATGHTKDLPAYLVAAAAVESRAFPTLVYDPSLFADDQAGDDWATRFIVDKNPDVAYPWPTHSFEYENESHEAQSKKLAFTLADFIAMDDRFKEHFAIVPNADLNDAMISVSDSLKSNSRELPTAVPSIALIDVEGCLHHAIVDRRILEETRRSQNMWRSLQELGGIHNSHAERLVEQVKAELAKVAASPTMLAATAQPVTDKAAMPAPVSGSDAVVITESSVASVEESHGDDPYIETARCTTCNECTQVNSKMFAYNAEKQAYIADPDAGTYRQLVEAAEGCQVSIIHPGKPRNPKESGLDDLLERAVQFN
ncbi:MAG TPA: ferredoxin [Candidatus Kapabacteria bacterium]|nr:ferredoxin [Candidatus Kapabacteria bacterium]